MAIFGRAPEKLMTIKFFYFQRNECHFFVIYVGAQALLRGCYVRGWAKKLIYPGYRQEERLSQKIVGMRR